jgi:LuxR family transcriptional regulator
MIGHDLTMRELKVLTLLSRGRTAGEIGAILSITPRTASILIQQVTFKLGASDSREVVVIAIRDGLVIR